MLEQSSQSLNVGSLENLEEELKNDVHIRSASNLDELMVLTKVLTGRNVDIQMCNDARDTSCRLYLHASRSA